jgi:hypothetical protein
MARIISSMYAILFHLPNYSLIIQNMLLHPMGVVLPCFLSLVLDAILAPPTFEHFTKTGQPHDGLLRALASLTRQDQRLLCGSPPPAMIPPRSHGQQHEVPRYTAEHKYDIHAPFFLHQIKSLVDNSLDMTAPRFDHAGVECLVDLGINHSRTRMNTEEGEFFPCMLQSHDRR